MYRGMNLLRGVLVGLGVGVAVYAALDSVSAAISLGCAFFILFGRSKNCGC